jgi:hypothetical protein
VKRLTPRRAVTLLRLLPALIAGVAGCQGPDEDVLAWPADDGPRWAPGEEWRLSEQPLVTIGAVDGPEAIGTVGRLPDESGVALMDNGRIAVADGQADEIRIYDGSGTLLASVGRTGDGPGEFRGIRGIEGFAGDSLLAWDSRAGFFVGRLSIFSAEGAFVRTLPTMEMSVNAVIGVAEDGTSLVEPQQSATPGWERPDAGEFREPRHFQRLSTSGEPIGTFGPVPGRERAAVGPTQTAAVYYGRDTYVAVGARYIYSGDSGRFEVAVHDRETGRVLRYLRRPYDPVAVSAEELSGRRELMRTAYARRDSINAGFGPELQQRLRELSPAQEDIPARETHPVFNRIIEDPDENLWVRHTVATADSAQTWSIFDPEGSWLGEVDIPTRMSVRAIGSEEIAVVTRDELGVEYVLLFRLLK